MKRDQIRENMLSAMQATVADPDTPAGARIAAARLVCELAGLLTNRVRPDDGGAAPAVHTGSGSADEVRSLELRLMELDRLIAEAEASELQEGIAGTGIQEPTVTPRKSRGRPRKNQDPEESIQL